MDIICINDSYSESWLRYFNIHGIIYPKVDKIYSVREIIPNSMGEKGLLLNEIVNPKTPRISPMTGVEGTSEQNFAVSRFATLLGHPLTEAMLKEEFQLTH